MLLLTAPACDFDIPEKFEMPAYYGLVSPRLYQARDKEWISSDDLRLLAYETLRRSQTVESKKCGVVSEIYLNQSSCCLLRK